MKLKHALMALVLATLTACSAAPSDAVMAKQIQSTMNREMGTQFVRVDHLKKTNGRKGGDNTYIANLEYDITFTKGMDAVASAMMGGGKGVMGSAAAAGLKMAMGDFKAGDTKHVKGTYTFAKSEKGWVLTK